MLLPVLLLLALDARNNVMSFPFMLNHPGVDLSLLPKRSQHERRQTTCPNNPNHQGAAPFNPQFPYTGAKNGLPGTQIGGIVVPDVNDTAHKFEAPGPLDIVSIDSGHSSHHRARANDYYPSAALALV